MEGIQNPNALAPKELVDNMTTLSVEYCDFTGKIQAGEIVIHRLVSDDVISFFKLAVEYNFPIESVIPVHNKPFNWNDTKSCELNNSSGFNFRNIVSGQNLSKHSIGCAFDVNPRQNPYISYEDKSEVFTIPKNTTYNPEKPGTLTKNHPLVQHMENLGWVWGGDWSIDSGRIDYQHFEIVPRELESFLK